MARGRRVRGLGWPGKTLCGQRGSIGLPGSVSWFLLLRFGSSHVECTVLARPFGSAPVARPLWSAPDPLGLTDTTTRIGTRGARRQFKNCPIESASLGLRGTSATSKRVIDPVHELIVRAICFPDVSFLNRSSMCAARFPITSLELIREIVQ